MKARHFPFRETAQQRLQIAISRFFIFEYWVFWFGEARRAGHNEERCEKYLLCQSTWNYKQAICEKVNLNEVHSGGVF